MRRLASLLLACALLAGSLASTASPASAAGGYLLPAPGGTQLYVTTGNGGLHQGWEYYAWDFTVGKTEFPVAAARGGVVIGAWGGSQDPQDNCYPDGSCWTRANYVLVDHCDGKTAGLYMHLAYGTVNVAVGQRVTTGTILGNADNTGWSSGTHLHFQVEQLPPGVDGNCSGPPPASATGSAGWWFRQSVPITFGDFDVLAKTSGGTLGVPVKGQTYNSSNSVAAPVATPTPAPVVSGTWVAPTDGAKLTTSTLTLSAKPAVTPPTLSSSKVAFSVAWGSTTKAACSATKAGSGGVWSCTVDLWKLGATLGKLTVSFDVTDSAGDVAKAPAGTRSVTFAAPPGAPTNVTMQVDWTSCPVGGSAPCAIYIRWHDASLIESGYRIYVRECVYSSPPGQMSLCSGSFSSRYTLVKTLPPNSTAFEAFDGLHFPPEGRYYIAAFDAAGESSRILAGDIAFGY